MDAITAKQRSICIELENLQDRAMRAGLPITTRAIEAAKNCWGWEVSGDLTNAAALVCRSTPANPRLAHNGAVIAPSFGFYQQRH